MNWLTLLSTTLVPVASVASTAAVAIWTKRIDARTKREDRQHALALDYESRAGEDKRAVLKTLISATLHLKRGAEPLVGADQTADERRTSAIRELYGFRERLGLDDGVAELLIYAAEPVRDLVNLLLDEWDREFREHGYSLAQLDSCKRRLAGSAGDGQTEWDALHAEETAWLERLGRESRLDVDAMIDVCARTLRAAHKDLRGGYGVDVTW